MIDETEIETEASEAELEDDAPSRPETAEETARAVYEELAAKAEQEQPAEPAVEEPKEEPNEITEAARKLASARKTKKRQTFVPVEETEAQQGAAPAAAPAEGEDIEPPASWSVSDKEWFMAQPPVVKRNAAKWFKDAQGHSTKLWQEMNREKEAAREINAVAEEFLPKLELPPGMTKGQVVRQLFEYQKRINEDDVGALVEMMQYRKVSLEDLQARMTGQTAAPRRAEAQQPQQRPLTREEIEAILDAREQQRNQSREAQAATDDVRSLGREVQNGRYVWPEMHSPDTIQRIQPLVSYFRETNPGESWGQTYKRAITQHRANLGISTGSPSPQSPRLTSTEIQTVRQASSSLRSRGGNGAIPRMADPKPNETARESAEAAYYAIFGNKQH